MKHHNELSDQEFETQFSKGDLPSSLFTHEAHLRLAWIYLKKYGLPGACDKVCTDISNFDRIHGKGDKFNKTITIASIKVVHHFMLKTESLNFKQFIGTYPKLGVAFKELLEQHYSDKVFSDSTSKTAFLEPDLLPFD
ncbi:MAG: hypothetical protein AAF969_03270 [Bacteroidota bacterium]